MAGRKRVHAINGKNVVDDRIYVWSILDNAWVPLGYWLWVNGKGRGREHGQA